MSNEIKESDWKLFRRLHPIARDRMYERGIAQMQRYLGNEQLPVRDRYLNAVEFAEDHTRVLVGLFDDFRRSTALLQISYIRRYRLLTDEEMAQFSPEAREFVENVLKIAKS